MAELIDLKLPKKTKKELKADMPMTAEPDQPQYPYGSRLDFDTDQLKKIPALRGVDAGEMVSIVAKAKVVEVRVTDRDGEKKREHVELQIQEIAISRDSQSELAAGFKAANT